MKIKKRASSSDEVFYKVINVVLFLLLCVSLYPLFFIVSASFSDPAEVAAGNVILFPKGFSLLGYKAVFEHKSVMTGFMNSGIYVLFGTMINITLTMFAAYALARKTLPGKKIILFIFTLTMIFSGGMIPTYIVVKNLGIMNTRWAMLLPSAITIYFLIIARTFIQTSIPDELHEAMVIDGGDDFQFFFHVVLPLSKSLLAVLTLFYAVQHWNVYFDAFLYLSDKELHPIQLFLRDILIANSMDASMATSLDDAMGLEKVQELIKYSLIVVSTLPIVIIYPFVQKYFVHGVMIGSVKG